jgi:hypothetical protein
MSFVATVQQVISYTGRDVWRHTPEPLAHPTPLHAPRVTTWGRFDAWGFLYLLCIYLTLSPLQILVTIDCGALDIYHNYSLYKAIAVSEL